jgi:hypothetical protein
MKNTTVRLAVTAAVAVLSVVGLSQAPADAKVPHHSAKTVWCC